jgi:hypothetical protein
MVLAVLLVAVASGSATAVTIQLFNTDSLHVPMADPTDLDDVVVESRELDLSGGDIVGVSTAINNTQSTTLDVKSSSNSRCWMGRSSNERRRPCSSDC